MITKSITPERVARIRATLNRRQPDLAVMTDHIHKPHNISAILRTCDAVGIQHAHIVMRESASFRARSGIARGSDRWLDVNLYSDAAEVLPLLKSQGMNIYAAQMSDRAIDYRDVDFTQPSVLLMGAEKWGVSELAAESADGHIIIPMMGMVESYNVSVAAAIILAEAQRQRTLANMYDTTRLSKAEYQRIFFKWCQPKLAALCDRHQWEYPSINAEGIVVGELPQGVEGFI